MTVMTTLKQTSPDVKEAVLKTVSPVPEEDVFHCRLHVMERETVKMERMSLLYVVLQIALS